MYVYRRLAPPIYARKTGQNQFPQDWNRLSSASLFYWRLGLATPPLFGKNHINTAHQSQSSSRFHTVHFG